MSRPRPRHLRAWGTPSGSIPAERVFHRAEDGNPAGFSPKPLPCPWGCVSSVIYLDSHGEAHWAECPACGSRGPTAATPPGAARRWNRRAGRHRGAGRAS